MLQNIFSSSGIKTDDIITLKKKKIPAPQSGISLYGTITPIPLSLVKRVHFTCMLWIGSGKVRALILHIFWQISQCEQVSSNNPASNRALLLGNPLLWQLFAAKDQCSGRLAIDSSEVCSRLWETLFEGECFIYPNIKTPKAERNHSLKLAVGNRNHALHNYRN